MTVKLISRILLVCLLAGSFAAPAVAADELDVPRWNATYTLGFYTDFEAAVQTPDGGYLLGGLGGSEDSDATAVLLKINESGTAEWNRTYTGYSVADTEQTPDGGYLLATYAISVLPGGDDGNPAVSGVSRLIKTDADGGTRWEQLLDGVRATSLTLTPGGHVLVTGWEWTETAAVNGFVAEYDAEGSELAAAALEGKAPYTIEPSGEGFLVAGGSSPLAGVSGDGWVVRLNNSLDPVWEAGFPGREAYALTTDAAGGSFVGGSASTTTDAFGEGGVETDAWVAKLTPEGTEVFNETVSGFAVYGVAAVPGSGYVAAGMWGDSPMVLLIGEDGEERAASIFKDRDGRLSAAAATADGGALVAGWMRSETGVNGWVLNYADPAVPGPVPTESPGFAPAAALLAAGAGALLAGRRR
jgi:hypothetical protein